LHDAAGQSLGDILAGARTQLLTAGRSRNRRLVAGAAARHKQRLCIDGRPATFLSGGGERKRTGGEDEQTDDGDSGFHPMPPVPNIFQGSLGVAVSNDLRIVT